jgi:Flp pilus assembly protein TadB
VAQGEATSALNDYWQSFASNEDVIEQQVVSERTNKSDRSTISTQEICSKKIQRQEEEILSSLSHRAKEDNIELDSSSEQTIPKVGLTDEESIHLAYSSGATRERRSLLKIWCACVVGTALSFSLVSGIKDIRSLVTTSLSAGSFAFVVSAIRKKE